jgi:UDP-N-acetyl-2-amino-2-deoxyglucuronate dehydrogenase
MSYARQWAVIGLGFISKRHLEAIKKMGDEVLVTCDVDPAKNADFTDWRTLRTSNLYRRVTHVAVCTPNHLHGEMARAFLADGKNVLCEKPLVIDNNYEGLEDVGVVLQLRFNPDIQKIKESLKGKNNSVSIDVETYREDKYWDSWKGNPLLSGGILYNMGVHYIDLLTHLLGEPLEILSSETDFRYKAYGMVRFEKGIGHYSITLTREPTETKRNIVVNGKASNVEGATIPLSNATNQGYQDLHTDVYKNFLEGTGIGLEEAKKSLELVKKLINVAK